MNLSNPVYHLGKVLVLDTFVSRAAAWSQSSQRFTFSSRLVPLIKMYLVDILFHLLLYCIWGKPRARRNRFYK